MDGLLSHLVIMLSLHIKLFHYYLQKNSEFQSTCDYVFPTHTYMEPSCMGGKCAATNAQWCSDLEILHTHCYVKGTELRGTSGTLVC